MLAAFSHVFGAGTGDAHRNGKDSHADSDVSSAVSTSAGSSLHGDCADDLGEDIDAEVAPDPSLIVGEGARSGGGAESPAPPEGVPGCAPEEERDCFVPPTKRPSRLPHARREARARTKYARSARGTYSKTRCVCDWDYDSDGNLMIFPAEAAFLEHEEACHVRRCRGEHPRKYDSLSAEQQALAAAVNSYADERGAGM